MSPVKPLFILSLSRVVHSTGLTVGSSRSCDRTGEWELSWQGTALSSTGQASGKWEQSSDSDSDHMSTGKSYSDEAGQGRKSIHGLGPGSPSSQKCLIQLRQRSKGKDLQLGNVPEK